MPDFLKIAIVDDHQIVIDGLILLLHDDPRFRIVGTANSGGAMLELLETQPVDMLLTDVMMPGMNGYELSKKVKQRYPHIKILTLSMSGQADLVTQMVEEASIQGYVVKNIGKQELISAIEKIAAGGNYFSQEVLDELANQKQIRIENEEVRLTERELDIIRCIEKEMSNREIAEALFISERTVETHRKNIFRKTGASSLIGLVKYAYEHKLI
jgi:two-component system, NarL family, nitrate/nitrite response regulator NarL